MEKTRPHQARAAQCRHAAAIQEQAKFWSDLDTRFRTFNTRLPAASLKRFCSIERRREDLTQGRAGFRPSTLQRWLRDWCRNSPISIDSSKGEKQ